MGMVSGMFSFILPLSILLLLSGLTIPVIWRTITPPRKGARVPSCEKCRYPVAGHNSFSCPECGADLRVTGIITRPMEMRRRGHLLGALLAWTFLALLVSYLSLLFVTAYSSGVASASTTVATYALTPASAVYRRIELSQQYGAIGTPIDLTLVLNDGSGRKLALDYAAGTAQAADAAGLQTTFTIDDKLFPAWFAAAGLPTDDPVVAAEVRDLQKVADYAGAGGWNPGALRLNKLTLGTPTYATAPATSSAPPSGASMLSQWMIPLAFGGFALLWLLGVVALVLRRRQLMREARAADTPAPTALPGNLAGG